jgi:hypothetical protein
VLQPVAYCGRPAGLAVEVPHGPSVALESGPALCLRRAVSPAGEIFTVLTDPWGHVAIDSSGMLMAASGDVVARVEDTFVVHMDREALNDYPSGCMT